MKNFILSSSLFQGVVNGENTVNLQECVLVNIVSEKHGQTMSVLCKGIELVDGKFNTLELFKALGCTVIEWFDEDKPDYTEGIFDTADDKERYFVVLNEFGFAMKVAYGLTDTVDFGSDGWGTKFTVVPSAEISDYMVSRLEAYCKRSRLEVTFNR